MMKIRTGVDIAHIPRFERLMENEAFIRKAFHESECAEYKAEHLAGIFAAKEAFFKAIGQMPQWLMIEVKKEKSGRPFLALPKAVMAEHRITDADVSISHDCDYAVASVSLIIE